VVIVKVLHAANVDGKKFGSRKVWLTSRDHVCRIFSHLRLPKDKVHEKKSINYTIINMLYDKILIMSFKN
jgi:hypothetical protein